MVKQLPQVRGDVHRRPGFFPRALVSALAAGSCATAFAFEFPPNLPARNEGLWQMSQTATVRDGGRTLEVRKVWNVCLDARASRALHELEVRERQASAAGRQESCEDPRPEFSGNTLSWAMHCTGRSPTAHNIDIRHATLFLSRDETRAESAVTDRGGSAQRRDLVFTHMKRLGACEKGWKPGDMRLMHWRVDGDETLKGRQDGDVYREIENHKAFTASRLGR